jgi:hypothetical protein
MGATPELRRLEGRRVSLALTGGQRIDDCQLISAGRSGCRNVWVFDAGNDRFVSHEDIVDCWESLP